MTVRDIDLDTEEFYVGGQRLTEARAAELAARAERRGGGRPSLGAPGTHAPTLNVRVSQATKSGLEALAASTGRRQSDLVREAIDEYLQHHRDVAS